MKKKLFIMTMAVCMVLSLSACGEGTNTAQSGENSIEEVEKPEVKTKKEETTRIVSVDNISDHVTIAQYKGIELDSISSKVTDEMVEMRISEILSESSKETQGSKAEVQEGDLITVSYIGTIDGKAFDGGTVTYYDWTVGDGEVWPEFETGVIGMKRGETREILCRFPEDYQGAELAGKEVAFDVTLQTIRRTPEFDDKWVSANSQVTTVEEYRETVRADLEAEMSTYVENQLKSTAWENIVTNSAMIEYPEQDIENAKASFNAQMTAYAQSYEMGLEEFAASQGMSMAEYEEQCQLYAERKVKQNLIVQGIIDEEGIRLDDEEGLEIQTQLMETYGAESLAELVDMYSQAQIDESIALLKVENFIYENAVIVEPMAVVSAAEDADVQENETEQEEVPEEISEEVSEESTEESIDSADSVE